MDILPEGKNGVFTRRFPDGTFKSWPAKKPEQTAGIVCEKSCNNGWMSNKLENPMKAVTKDIIINQTAKSFSPSDCAVIAAWAFKTTVLSNHIDLADKEPFFSADQRRSFAQNLTIPKGVQAWIARRNAGHLSARYFAKKRLVQGHRKVLTPHLIKPPLSAYRFEIYECVLSVGYLLLQVTAARWAEREVANRLDFPPITQHKLFDDYAIPIWPRPAGGITWPPRLAVGNDLFESFCERFDRINLPSWMID